MNQKQYEDMRTIMQFGRLFADAMRRAMINSGLLEQDYEMVVHIKNYEIDAHPGSNLVGEVALKKYPARNEDWYETSLVDFKFEKEGWMVNHDIVVKPGSLPPDVRIAEKAGRVYQSREEGTKPFAPDGLWLSSRDNCDPVDGGM
jgi:hypothetical protein